MRWEKVGRLPLPVKGELVEWAEERNLELVRVDSVYQFFEEDGQKSFIILRRCSNCGHVQVLDAYFSKNRCENCDELGDVE